MWNSEEVYEKLLDGWERSETNSGIPYYINHKTERTQWDHPFFVKTLEDLEDMNSIQYAAYRMAMKLRFIQKRLKMDLVDLGTVCNVFERHGFPSPRDTVVDCPDLYSILVDIYNLTRKQMPGNMKAEQSAELLLNWLLNLFDVNRTGCIRVLSVKLGLATICSARLAEKYRYYFRQLCDQTNHIERKKMGAFLHDIMQIPEMLNESIPFGGLNVGPATNSCFSRVWSAAGVSEDIFLDWLLHEPQTLVWLPTMHRLAAAETVKHEAKCNICKQCPIIGMRYRCLKCFNYDVCQNCFFTGRTSKKHKLKHPTQEYCVATTNKEDAKAFMKTVRNNLSKKHRRKQKLRYLPIHGTDQPYNSEEFAEKIPEEDVHKMLGRAASNLAAIEVAAPRPRMSKALQTDPMRHTPPLHIDEVDQGQYGGFAEDERQELESIIHHLEHENRDLIGEIERLHDHSDYDSDESEAEWLRDEREKLQAKQEILESHNRQLELQLQRLRMLVRQGDGGNYRSHRQPLAPVSQNIPTREPSIGTRSLYKNPPPMNVSPLSPYDPNEEGYQPSFHPVQANRSSLRPEPGSQAQLVPNVFVEPGAASSNPVYRHSPTMDRHHSRLSPAYGISPAVEPSCARQSSGIHPRSSPHPLAPRVVTPNPALEGQLDIDISYGSLDPLSRLGETHFTLPSPEYSREYPEEEAELNNMLERLELAYPLNTPRSAEQAYGPMDEMYQAATKIGDAMSEFVGKAGDNGNGVHHLFDYGQEDEEDIPLPGLDHSEQTVPDVLA